MRATHDLHDAAGADPGEEGKDEADERQAGGYGVDDERAGQAALYNVVSIDLERAEEDIGEGVGDLGLGAAVMERCSASESTRETMMVSMVDV